MVLEKKNMYDLTNKGFNIIQEINTPENFTNVKEFLSYE